MILINKGTGAGGSNCAKNGNNFEQKTDSIPFLLKIGYQSHYSNREIYFKTCDNIMTVCLNKHGFKNYIKTKYNIDMIRLPDEAYIIIKHNTDAKIVIKILEKKNQNCNGSVETKLWASPSLKREYELVFGSEFEVHYGLCVNNFLQIKLQSDLPKYKILNKILEENKIKILYGDNPDYFETLQNWVKL